MIELKEMNINEFSRQGRKLGLKGGEYCFNEFYRLIYKNHVTLEMFLDESLPLNKLLGLEASKENMTKFYQDLSKKYEIPMGSELFKTYLRLMWTDFLDFDKKQPEGERKFEGKDLKEVAVKVVNYVLDQDLSTYPTYIQELIKNIDREELIEFLKAIPNGAEPQEGIEDKEDIDDEEPEGST